MPGFSPYLYYDVVVFCLVTGASKMHQQHTHMNSSLSSAGSNSPGFRTTSNSSPASTTGPKANISAIHRNGNPYLPIYSM